MQSLPGVLLLSKLSRRRKHSSAEILPSQNFFWSSESAGIFKSFRKEEILNAISGWISSTAFVQVFVEPFLLF